MSGSITFLRKALDSILLKPYFNWHGYLSSAINITLCDSITSTNANFPLTVTSVNDAPLIVMPKNSLYSAENEMIISDYISISIEDEDMMHSPNLKSTMTVNITTKFGGKLHMSKFIVGCYVVYPTGKNPSTKIVFRGTINSINEAFQNLVFSRNSDYDFLDVITIEVNDEGNFGEGGHLSSLAHINVYSTITEK